MVLRSPAPDPRLLISTHHSWYKRQDWPADDCSPNATLDAIALPFTKVLCYPMFSLVSPVIPWWFFKLFPVNQNSVRTGTLALLLSGCRIWHFPLLNLKRFLSAHSSSLLRCLWVAADPPIASSTSHRFLLCPSLAETPLCPTGQIIDEDVK